MNKEIKEILEKLKDEYLYTELDLTGIKWIELKQEETNQLLDYITNLQQENERLKAIWKDTNVIIKDDKTLVMNTNAYDCLEDYKSRCEKAIEYIKEHNVIATDKKYLPREYEYCCSADLLNILQNK